MCAHFSSLMSGLARGVRFLAVLRIQRGKGKAVRGEVGLSSAMKVFGCDFIEQLDIVTSEVEVASLMPVGGEV